MNNTGISWTNLTWNPVSGCKKLSQGCKYCYAHTIAEKNRGGAAFPNGFDITLRPYKLKEPFNQKQQSLIFVNSMSDMFWEEITDDYRDQILDVIRQTPQHQYQVLTKRAENMLRYCESRELPDNYWAGVSIEDMDNVGRLDILKQVKAKIRFISFEPLLSEILNPDLNGIHWVITGGESGAHLREPRIADKRALVYEENKKWIAKDNAIEWVRAIKKAAHAAGAAFYHKQWGGSTSNAGGRELDGQIWDEMPDF